MLLIRISSFSISVSRRRTSSVWFVWFCRKRDHLGRFSLAFWREYRDVKREVRTKPMATKVVRWVMK